MYVCTFMKRGLCCCYEGCIVVFQINPFKSDFLCLLTEAFLELVGFEPK